MDVLEVYAQTPVVFVGEVTKREPVTYDGRAASEDQAVRAAYTIRVLEEFKGTGAREYRLLGDAPIPSPPPGSDLIIVNEDNWPLELHQRYLVFATGDPLRIDSCASAALTDATDALKKLRAARSRSHRGASGGLQIHKQRSLKDKLLGRRRMEADDPFAALVESTLKGEPEFSKVERRTA